MKDLTNAQRTNFGHVEKVKATLFFGQNTRAKFSGIFNFLLTTRATADQIQRTGSLPVQSQRLQSAVHVP
jgi:hypothetical protein